MARAFLAAGAPSVIANLWAIEDSEAAEFFPLVHARLAAGDSPATALRAAQREWMRDPRASLALWTAVQVIGS